MQFPVTPFAPVFDCTTKFVTPPAMFPVPKPPWHTNELPSISLFERLCVTAPEYIS